MNTLCRLTLNKRDACFLMEVLRYWQRDMDMDGFVSELTTEEIDELCERINLEVSR